MNQLERIEHLEDLWATAFLKARGGALVLKWVSDLRNKILMFGVKKGLEELENIEKPLPFIIMPHSSI
jgi:hypothetical protein